ncbi:hypothetical protein [Ruegeria faecimaris]|nr:hypothetical protein [Ruegeria faecimaris]
MQTEAGIEQVATELTFAAIAATVVANGGFTQKADFAKLPFKVSLA